MSVPPGSDERFALADYLTWLRSHLGEIQSRAASDDLVYTIDDAVVVDLDIACTAPDGAGGLPSFWVEAARAARQEPATRGLQRLSVRLRLKPQPGPPGAADDTPRGGTMLPESKP